ncbi:MAG: site-specific integrase [Ruminococcaceae bacterium]|nr:site-specific integrase [Oscillospiraceae bacterium]
MPINKMTDSKGKAVKNKEGLQGYRVRINYTDSNGKARQVERTAYGLGEAQTLEQKLIQEYKDKKLVAASKMTINELYTEYMKYHATETRKSSDISTASKLQKRVLPYFGECRLDKLTQKDLADWKIEISKQDLALRTKQNGYMAFRALLNYAVKMEYIPKNPLTVLGGFKDVTGLSENSTPEKFQYYTAEQFLKYIAAAKENCITVTDWGYYVFFNILFYCGLRKGEANALKWSDIRGNMMYIRRSIFQKAKGEDVETAPKTASSSRDIQIPLPLMKILEEHKERQKQAAGELFSENLRVCGCERPLRDTSIENKNKAFSSAADLPHIRIHDFRHSHASLLANEGINIQEVARRLGHSNVKMTLSTYSHLYPREEERAISVLNKIAEK